MPRFMGFVRMEEGVGTPPQALFDAMDAHVGERAAKGVFLDGGGLYGTEDAVNFVVRQGEVSRIDGPYAEAKEVVGGWAIMQYDSLEEAVADQREFAELHAKYWPEVTVISTLRQISTGPEAPATDRLPGQSSSTTVCRWTTSCAATSSLGSGRPATSRRSTTRRRHRSASTGPSRDGDSVALRHPGVAARGPAPALSGGARAGTRER